MGSGMKTVAIASAKGGSGKTTLTLNLAVLASEGGLRTAILDLDPQGSAADWRQVRSKDKRIPTVDAVKPAKLVDVVAAHRRDATDWLFLDTPPNADRETLRAIALADFTVVPVRPAPLDLQSARRTLDAMAERGTPYVAVLNGCPPSPRGEASIVIESRAVLKPHPVAPMSLSNRVAHSYAQIAGQSVVEYEPTGRAAVEVVALWDWLKKQIGYL